jgi:hypothetical protein
LVKIIRSPFANETDDLLNTSPRWFIVSVAAACAATMAPIKKAMAAATAMRFGMVMLASD